MEKKIKLIICDHCDKGIESLSMGKCNVCEKDYCKDCSYDSKDSGLKGYLGFGYSNDYKLSLCKHCVDKLADINYKKGSSSRHELFPRYKDFRMSGSGSLIDMGSYFRYFNEKFVKQANNTASEIFYTRCKSIIAGTMKEEELKKKEKELAKEYEDRIKELRNPTDESQIPF